MDAVIFFEGWLFALRRRGGKKADGNRMPEHTRHIRRKEGMQTQRAFMKFARENPRFQSWDERAQNSWNFGK